MKTKMKTRWIIGLTIAILTAIGTYLSGCTTKGTIDENWDYTRNEDCIADTTQELTNVSKTIYFGIIINVAIKL